MTDVRPYGVAVQQAVAGGDLAQMKKQPLLRSPTSKSTLTFRPALEVLKAEIAKLEAKK